MDQIEQKKLLSLLNFMVEDHERRFDKETAKYLLTRISDETLLESACNINIKNFYVSGSFWGNILIKNSYNISKNNYSTIETWKELLLEKNPKLLEHSDLIFNLRNKKEQAPKSKKEVVLKGKFIDFYFINNLDDCIKNPEKEIVGSSVKDVNPIIVTLDYICDEQNGYYFPNNSSEPKKPNSIDSEYLLNLVIQGKKNILKNEWHDDTSFTNRVFRSRLIKKLMTDVDVSVLEQLFSQESLGAIIKQSNTFDSIKSNRNLFLDLSPLASPEKWLNGWRKVQQKKSIDLVEFFNNKFNYGFGLNLHLEYRNGLRKEGKPYSPVAEVFIEEFKFFLPALAKMELDKNKLCLLVNGILRSQNIELMSVFLNHFDIPKVNSDESPESIKIYERMMSTMNSIDNLNYKDTSSGLKANNWHEAIALIQAAKLNKDLANKDELIVKRSLKL